ncbi:hypothetical protein BTA51_27645 [Hahella sp. CCB-MM4]|nr:hypothetical protein BTA51_27645 [Hahella sp. CCB-MM4]
MNISSIIFLAFIAVVTVGVLFFLVRILFIRQIRAEQEVRISRRDALETVVGVSGVLILIWFKEQGENWAAALLGVVLLCGKMYLIFKSSASSLPENDRR